MPRKANGQISLFDADVIKQIPSDLKQKPEPKIIKQLPQEYNDLLEETRLTLEDKVRNAKNEVAGKYVPKMYKLLAENDYSPENIRRIIMYDTVRARGWWKPETVLKHMDSAAKHQGRRRAGLISSEKKKEKKLRQVQQLENSAKAKTIDTLKTTLKGIAGLPQEKIDEIASTGGKAVFEQHGSKYMSDNGRKGMQSRWGTLNVVINDQDHTDIIQAYNKSLALRANGTGMYVIHLKDGEFDHAEPKKDTLEEAVQRVNK